VKQASRLLEHVPSRFFQIFEGAGFHLERPAEKLVWVLLTDRHLFNQYAAKTDGISRNSLNAYYSARSNRVALLIDPQSGRQNPFTDFARARHEAAHQLAFNTKLQTRGVMYPLWATEGLACILEYESENPIRRE
jgi:hypothetical protein